MGREKTLQIHLDPNLIEEFNASLNTHEHISEQISFVRRLLKRRSIGAFPLGTASVFAFIAYATR